MRFSLIDLQNKKLKGELISEDELLNMAKIAEQEYKTGKTKTLKSLKDLM